MLYDEILGEGCVANTVIHYHAVIRKALAYAVKMQYIPTNPADLVTRPKKNRHISKYYTKEETAVLLEMAKDDPIYIPILLAAYYGLRRSEVLGLRWSAVDFEKKTLTVNHKVEQTREEGKLVVYAEDKLKTKSSYRTLPLIPFVEQELLKLKQQQEEHRKLFKKNYSKEHLDYICVNEKGELFRPNYISEHFRWFLEKHGLKVIRFHELRHPYVKPTTKNIYLYTRFRFENASRSLAFSGLLALSLI
ncbi:tyrosine recombinase XerC [Clostridiales bacterium]|nr:tyrosine recombinase XerC [Clostridiales bacterium]